MSLGLVDGHLNILLAKGTKLGDEKDQKKEKGSAREVGEN